MNQNHPGIEKDQRVKSEGIGGVARGYLKHVGPDDIKGKLLQVHGRKKGNCNVRALSRSN